MDLNIQYCPLDDINTWSFCAQYFWWKLHVYQIGILQTNAFKIFLTVTHNKSSLLHHDPEYVCVYVCVCLNVKSLTEINTP